MIRHAIIEGRPANVAYLNDAWEPVADTLATLVKVNFLDAEGGMLFLVPAGETRARDAWREEDHPRGKTTEGSTPGSFAPGGGAGSEGKKKGTAKPGKGDFEKAGIKFQAYGKEEDAIEDWHKFVGMEPQEFKQKFLGGMNGTMEIRGDPAQDIFKVEGRIEGEGKFAGQYVGSYDRELNFRKKEGYSSYFQVIDEAQKEGYGKKLLAGNVEMYEQFGFDSVKVTAGLTVGAYAWAKYGYVPDQSSWDSLRSRLLERVEGGGGGGRSSDNMAEAEEWSWLSEDAQERVQARWREDAREEFYESEVENWRESGDALQQAKVALAEDFDPNAEWARNAVERARERFDGDIPYTDEQLLKAITIEGYESKYDDGKSDPVIDFDDAFLKEPEGFDPKQMTLPGMEGDEPHERLTVEMRKRLTNELIDSFNGRAEDDAGDIEPPDYLREQVGEYMDEYWSSMSDSQMLEIAARYDLNYYESEPDEDEEETEPGEPEDEDSDLVKALKSRDPKSIWKVSDHPRGKELLLKKGWTGKLNLRDKESMDRFKEYVSRAKK